MGGVFDLLLGITSFVIVLSIVVFVHEFGHFQVARWLGVKIDAFSIGFGKELLAWNDKQGVRWRIGMLPLGGYVKFTGDKDASSFPDDIHDDISSEGNFHKMPVWVRAMVAAAGPIFNFVFSIAVFAIFFTSLGEMVQKPVVGQVLPNGAAYQAGLQAGDEFVYLENAPVDNVRDIQRVILTSGGKEINFKVKRNNETIDLKITPKIAARETPFGDKETQGFIGVYFSTNPNDITTIKYNLIGGVVRGYEKFTEIISMQVRFIGALLRGAMSAGHLSGPLGIGQSAEMVAKSSIESAGLNASFVEKVGALSLGLIELASVLSIAIGFMNLLPLPILDGGHLVFYAIEAVRGKPVPQNIQAASYKVGFACLMLLFVFATIQDLDRVGLFKVFSH
jgi:regulator of sigma E protease